MHTLRAMGTAQLFAVVLLATAPLAAAAETSDGCVEGACVPEDQVAMLQLTAQRRTVQKPATPALCTASNKGDCECADSANIQTFTYWDTDGVQQCFTAYVPPTAKKPMPVALYSQCYAKNKLTTMNNEKSKFLAPFARFGIAVVYLSSFKGSWTLGNDGIVNDAIPQPCDSPDLAYVETVLDHIATSPSVYDPSKVSTYGYSQNGQFSAYAGTCFADRMYGIWQGMAGLSIVGEKNPKIPPKAPECSTSSYKEYKNQCEQKAPCTECKYFPIYPCHIPGEHKTIHCQQGYNNDRMVSGESTIVDTDNTAGDYLFDTATAEGNPVRMLKFKEDTENGVKGGHAGPKNDIDWFVGCLGLAQPCSSACEAEVAQCAGKGTGYTWETYADCVTEAGTCEKGCAPTKSMLDLSETPFSKLSGWGAAEYEEVVGRPATSKCENKGSGGSLSPSPPSPSPPPPSATTTAAATTTADATTTAATTTPTPTTTKDDNGLGKGECSDTCSAEFVHGCMRSFINVRGKSEKVAYSKCRRQLDSGKGRISRERFGCKAKCTDTLEMEAAKSP